MSNKFVILILLLSAAALGLSACAPGSQEKAPESLKVGRGDILAIIPSNGTVMPYNRLEIKPPIAGRVEQVLVDEGYNVKKGEILAWMSSADRATLLDAARAKGADEVKYWEDVYKPTPIVAPLDGFIILRSIEPGQSATASDAILVMADHLIVKAQVDETDIGKIKLGQPVEIILDAYSDKKVPGKVEHIAYESTVINNVTIYYVDIVPDNVPSFFRSGMSATVNFISQEKNNVLVVPMNAIRKKNNRVYVFVPGNNSDTGKIVAKEISTGLESTDKLEVVSGLSEGDTIYVPTPTMVKNLLSDDRGPRFMSPFGGGSNNRRSGSR
ncbi:MAG TPA: HlyD family efflux transporter periplasmic adaptor subunit [Candidatus Omnitrophota bacterium]|nr:HlyD family efflux transporter periplasmic adaptor subunit [Candidatus Omnitrophota bacterium]